MLLRIVLIISFNLLVEDCLRLVLEVRDPNSALENKMPLCSAWRPQMTLVTSTYTLHLSFGFVFSRFRMKISPLYIVKHDRRLRKIAYSFGHDFIDIIIDIIKCERMQASIRWDSWNQDKYPKLITEAPALLFVICVSLGKSNTISFSFPVGLSLVRIFVIMCNPPG